MNFIYKKFLFFLPKTYGIKKLVQPRLLYANQFFNTTTKKNFELEKGCLILDFLNIFPRIERIKKHPGV